MTSMYAEEILDHYRNPRNFGELKDAQIKYKESNPLCGDEYEFYLKVNNGLVSDAKFFGDGCAISKASASMLSEHVKNKTLDDLKKMKLDDVLKLLGIEVSAARTKCALVALLAIQKGIQKFEGGKNDGSQR